MKGILTAITKDGYVVTVGPCLNLVVHPSHEEKKNLKIGDDVYLETFKTRAGEDTGRVKSIVKLGE